MKAEERHEQRESDMTGWLQYGLWNFVREYGSYVLLLGALGFLGYQLWDRHVQNKLIAYQKDFNSLRDAASGAGKTSTQEAFAAINPADPKLLVDLMDSTEFKEVKAQAALTLAGYYQDMVAFPEVLDMKNLRRDEVLNKAMESLQTALAAQPDDPLIVSRVHLGMAAVYEDQGLWDKAKSEYTMLSDPKGQFADSPTAVLAADRLKTLPDRQMAPRLVASIPKFKPAAQPSLPTIPNMPGSRGLMDLNSPLPGLLGPMVTPTSQSSTPKLPPTPMGPFVAPVIPGIAPEGPGPTSMPAPTPTPETAPAK